MYEFLPLEGISSMTAETKAVWTSLSCHTAGTKKGFMILTECKVLMTENRKVAVQWTFLLPIIM